MSGKRSAIPSEGSSCWREIGVLGTGTSTCSLLDEVIHCRNCERYGVAGRSLLDRPPPDGYLEEWAHALRKRKQTNERAPLSVLVFRLASEWLALETRLFQEVTEQRPVHRVPHVRDPVLLGVTSIRGRILICVSLTTLLGLEAGGSTRPSLSHVVYERMAVIGAESERFVFPVDEILGVRRFHLSQTTDIPATIARGKGTFTRALVPLTEGLFQQPGAPSPISLHHGGEQVGILDGELLLSKLRFRLSGGTFGHRPSMEPV